MNDERAPLGAWWRIYLLVCVLAAVMIAALLWFTKAWQIPMGGG